MKVKSWLKYLIFTTVIIFMIALWEYVSNIIISSYYRFESNSIYLIISLLLGISIGLLIGLEYFISEKNKEGVWKINYPKLLLIGLPSLYFSIAGILIYGNNQFMQTIIAYPLLWLMRFGLDHVDLFQILLGYTVITSFYKYSNNKLSGTAE